MRNLNKCLFVLIGILFFSVADVHSQQLYVGANYHPHDDKDLVKTQTCVNLMQAAGFKVVRMWHLAWGSYEPSEGNFCLKAGSAVFSVGFKNVTLDNFCFQGHHSFYH
jgi:hypothetical protein